MLTNADESLMISARKTERNKVHGQILLRQEGYGGRLQKREHIISEKA
jgi:hypothetical protein